MKLTPGTYTTFPGPSSGYVARLHEIYGRSSRAIEQILGLPPGILAMGWYLLYLADVLTVDDYEMRGAAWFSDGAPGGHKLDPSMDRRPLQPERVLQSNAQPAPWSQKDIREYKRKQLARLQIVGRERLVKVKSIAPSPTNPADYPPGTALAQFWVVGGKRFWVQAQIGPDWLTDVDWKALASRWQGIVQNYGRP